jgi:hypothetical protein
VDVWYLDKFTSGTATLNDVGIRPGQFLDVAETPVSRGAFSGLYAAQGADYETCSVPNLSPATQNGVTYALSNLVFAEGALFQGAVMGGELTYTEGACVVTYEVSAMWPGVVDCQSDDDCNEEAGISPALDSVCLALRAPNFGGYNPRTGAPVFNQTVCAPARAFPSLK